MVLNQSCAADQAHLRSHSGPGASEALSVCPSKPEICIDGELFRTMILERLDCLSRCLKHGVNAVLDREGRHRAACARSERLKTRALAPERSLARVCQEAGATVRYNARLRDMNLTVTAQDDRAIEVLASGLSLFFGAKLAVDISTADGTAQPGAARIDGAVCSRAREEKERRYSELLRGDRCRLVVVALGTGRLSEEALQFVESLAAAKARDAPHAMFHSAAQAWRRRALSILRPLFCKFVGAHCVACPCRNRVRP